MVTPTAIGKTDSLVVDDLDNSGELALILAGVY